MYLGPADFVLQEGRTWTPAQLPRGIRLGQPGQCYKNAFNLALRNRITYVEGYAGDVVPIAHAWCIDEEGRVVDNTWSDSEQCVYFGVAFDSEYVESTVLRQRIYGLIDMPETGWPLITGQHENWRHRSWSNAD